METKDNKTKMIKIIVWIVFMALLLFSLFHLRMNTCIDSGLTLDQCRNIIFGI